MAITWHELTTPYIVFYQYELLLSDDIQFIFMQYIMWPVIWQILYFLNWLEILGSGIHCRNSQWWWGILKSSVCDVTDPLSSLWELILSLHLGRGAGWSGSWSWISCDILDPNMSWAGIQLLSSGLMMYAGWPLRSRGGWGNVAGVPSSMGPEIEWQGLAAVWGRLSLFGPHCFTEVSWKIFVH